MGSIQHISPPYLAGMLKKLLSIITESEEIITSQNKSQEALIEIATELSDIDRMLTKHQNLKDNLKS